jgi:hypothetical protein
MKKLAQREIANSALLAFDGAICQTDIVYFFVEFEDHRLFNEAWRYGDQLPKRRTLLKLDHRKSPKNKSVSGKQIAEPRLQNWKFCSNFYTKRNVNWKNQTKKIVESLEEEGAKAL